MGRNRALVGLLSLMLCGALSPRAEATPYSPLAWQRLVTRHRNKAFVGQRKNTTWVRDRDRDFIDDEIARRFKPADSVDVVLQLNDSGCPGDAAVLERLGRFGKIAHRGSRISYLVLRGVAVRELPALAARPEVAMVEWATPLRLVDDVSGPSVQARSSTVYPGQAAQDSCGGNGTCIDGHGVRVAVLDTGIYNKSGQFPGAHAPPPGALVGTWVAGFDATDTSADLAVTDKNPLDDNGHGTQVAGIILGRRQPSSSCRTPMGKPADCAGMAPGAELVNVKVCKATGTTTTCDLGTLTRGLEWVAQHAADLDIRVANLSIATCTESDGTSVLDTLVDQLTVSGVLPVTAHGNATEAGACTTTVTSPSPGSASLAVTVAASDDKGTVSRSDDLEWSGGMTGPRTGFSLDADPLPWSALKPDLAAPGFGVMAPLRDSPSGFGAATGTSFSTAHVSGALALLAQKYPTMPPGSLKDLLLRTAVDASRNTAAYPGSGVEPWSSKLGWGLLAIGGALAATADADLRFPGCVGGASAGGPCNLAAPRHPWENDGDIEVTPAPRVGVTSTINVTVANPAATDRVASINVGIYTFNAGAARFHHVGTVRATLHPGKNIVSVPWKPDLPDHQCVQVSIDYGLDSDFTNNVTQRNLMVAGATFRLRVENPLRVKVRFEVQATSSDPRWACKVDKPTFELLPESCAQTVTVAYPAPVDAKVGTRAQCALAVAAAPLSGPDAGKTRIIGGATARAEVNAPCRTLGVVRDDKGQPVADSRIRFSQLLEDGKGGVPKMRPLGATVTDKQGVFTVNLPPGARVQAVLAVRGGEVSAEVVPACGLGGLTLELVEGKVLRQAP